MKKIFALVAILAFGSANASELKFGDLNYFLKQGQMNVKADFIANNETSRYDKGDSTEIDSYLLNTKFAYAINDSLNVHLGLDFLFDGESEDSRVILNGEGKPEVQTDASEDSMGLQNPKIGADFRLLSQKNAPFNLDFGAVATFKLTERKVGTADKEGNMINPLFTTAEPRSGLDLNARIGKKVDEANEYYFLAGVNYHLDGEYKQLQGSKVDVDSSTDLRLAGFYQYRPVNEFMMTLGLTATRVGETDFGNTTATSHMDYQFSFDAKYLITESVIAKFSFTKDKRDDFELETNSGDDDIDKRNSLQYGLGIDYLF